MMLFIGILILVGSAVDIAISAYTGLHLLLLICGILLIGLNVFGHKLPAGIAVGKTALSLAIIVLTGLSLFGFFTGSKLLESHNAQSVIKKAEKSTKPPAPSRPAHILKKRRLYMIIPGTLPLRPPNCSAQPADMTTPSANMRKSSKRIPSTSRHVTGTLWCR
jgi:hypothetical protein